MTIGDRLQHVTLDTTAGGVATPLDPGDWFCAYRSEGPTQGAFVGQFHPGITTYTRIHFRGRIYHVTAIDNRDERDVELTVHGTEVLDA